MSRRCSDWSAATCCSTPLQAVADEDAPAAFALAGRAVEMGYDLRLVCRELSRVVRDLLVLSVDPLAHRRSGDRRRGRARSAARRWSPRFSREDLLRAFDLLTRAEADIRGAAQPRYHLEMALLRWIHLRKLTPIEDLIAGAGLPATAAPAPQSASGRAGPAARQPRPASASDRAASQSPSGRAAPRRRRAASPPPPAAGRAPRRRPRAMPPAIRRKPAAPVRTRSFKDALLAEIRKGKTVFYNTVVAQAQKIEVDGDRDHVHAFAEGQRTLRDMFEQNRAWLETLAQQVAGRRIPVVSAHGRGRRPRRRRRRTPWPATTRRRRSRSRRSPTPACRRCSRCSPRKSATSRRCEDGGWGKDEEMGGGVRVMNIQQMMKQAQQMQERLQKQMAELRIEANAGGGMVTVVVNGAKQLQSLKIDPEVVSKEDVEMLQDLIVAAVNDAQRKADEEMSQKMGGMLPAG